MSAPWKVAKMKRTLVSSLAVVALFGALTVPAQATQGAQLTVVNSPLTDVCPVKVQFNGMVIGVPNLPFQYWFITLVNGVEQVTPRTTMLMPATGVVAVRYSLPIATSSDQTTTNIVELDATDLAGQARPTVSTQVKYFVTCRAPSTRFQTATQLDTRNLPPKSGTALSTAIQTIRAPTGLASTTDPGVCLKHFGPDLLGLVTVLCGAAIKDGLLLVWDWTPIANCAACPQAADGFRIYRSDGRALAATQNGANSAVGIKRPADGYDGKCYTATAYKGSTESSDSRQFCIGSAVAIGTQTAKFAPSHVRSPVQDASIRSGVCNSTTQHDYSDPSFEVGYEHTGTVDAVCNYHTSTFYRGAVAFDVSRLAGKAIRKATLRFGSLVTRIIPKTPISRPYFALPTSTTDSCATEIGTGRDEWWARTGWIEFDSISSNIAPAAIDVTVPVSRWLNGAPNDGFVMRGSNEGNQQTDFRFGCRTTFANISLEVEYYP